MNIRVFGMMFGSAVVGTWACSRPDPFAEVKNTAPVGTLAATEIVDAYTDNALSAEGQYTNKVVEVAGRFLLTQKETNEGAEVWYAVLDGGKATGVGSRFVRCYFDAADASTRQRFASLSNGTSIHVKGKASAEPFRVNLHGCALL
jgi:hypothetical protein